jgi:hypothetical protein
MRVPRLLLVSLVPLAGCGSQAAVCADTAEIHAIYGTVVDEAGGALPDTVVTYTLDGEARGECPFTEGAAFVCGGDEAGTFLLTTTLRGYYDLTQQVTAYMGACHVSSGSIQLEMVARDCTAEEVPSVAVTVSMVSRTEVPNPVVSWRRVSEATSTRTPCTGAAADWTCGSEVDGALIVFASADGYDEQSADVTVPLDADGCHVETVPVSFEFNDVG